jgi:hypothetical protein
MMTQREWWQLSKFQGVARRMPFDHEAIVGVEDTSPQAWLGAADVLVGQHRTRREARRWITSTLKRYPGCLVAVARHRRGRWCLVGLPARNIMMRGGRFDLVVAEQLGRVIYYLWSTRRAQL